MKQRNDLIKPSDKSLQYSSVVNANDLQWYHDIKIHRLTRKTNLTNILKIVQNTGNVLSSDAYTPIVSSQAEETGRVVQVNCIEIDAVNAHSTQVARGHAGLCHRQ